MPEITINEKIIRITGSASTDKILELGDDVVLLVKGSIVQTQDWDNQDGTKNRVYKVKVLSVENAE